MPVLPISDRPAPAPPTFTAPEAVPDRGPVALDLSPEADLQALAGVLPRAVAIRIAFPAFSDGRGFGLGRRLRDLGFRGHLRAAGPLIPDQRAALAACGFDAVELAEALHARHGAAAWAAAAAPPPFRRRLGLS